MIKYVSIDVETTGLDCTSDQILEIGAVRSWDEAAFQCAIKWDRIAGHPIALSMNARLLNDPTGIDIVEGIQRLNEFIGPDKVTMAGKNPAFDWGFLVAAGFPTDRFYHRRLDPSILFVVSSDTVLPNLKTCCERAGIHGLILHSALDDAIAVHRLIQHAWRVDD